MKDIVHFTSLRHRLSWFLTAIGLLALHAPTVAQTTYGMTIQPRPNTTTTTFYDYDWTGLTTTFNFIYWDGTPDSIAYDQNFGGNWVNGLFDWTFLGPDYSIYYGKIALSGSSTYKWQWTVPDKVNMPGTPDLANFPVPPLFVMGRIKSTITSASEISGNTVGMTADGQLKDQWTTSPLALSQVPQTVSSSDQPRYGYGIVSTTLDTADMTHTTRQGLLSPQTFVEGNAYNATTDLDLSLFCEEHAFALELCDTNQQGFYNNGGSTNLDLFGYAQKRGDGKNQFVYDTSGNLHLPMGVNLNGASGDVIAADTDYLIHGGVKVQFNVDITYTTPTGSTLTAPTSAPTTVVPQTSLGNGMFFNGYLYNGLPALNTDLGNHVVKLQVKSGTTFQDSELAHIQTFFKSTDTTHPSPTGTAYEMGLPNWVYYYSQVYAPTSTWVYTPAGQNNTGNSYYTSNTDTIHIGSNADVQITNFHVFALPQGEQYVKWVGDLQVKGLYRYIKSAAHEQGHRNDFLAGIEGGLPDGDNDGISDTWESNHHFNPMSPDTTPAYRGEGGADMGKGDRECLCDIQALGTLVAAWNNGALLKDWANNGALFGQLPWPAGQAQWTYTPRDAMGNMGTPTNIIPSNVLIALP